MNGLPALALSLDIPSSGLWHFALASELAVPIVNTVIERGIPEWSVLNVNIPNRPQAEIKGTRLTRHGKSGFKEYYVEEAREGTRRRFRLEGSMVYRDEDTFIDAVALKDGWISATPLGLSTDDPAAWKKLEKWDLFSENPI